MAFLQDPPQLPHPYRSDRSLLALLDRALPADRRGALDADLDALGDYAQMAWQRACTTTRRKPVLTQWDAWGQRVDRIELTTAWQEGPQLTTRHAVLAAGHADSEHARLEEFARVYLYHLASEFYTCPLAMTDGAATAIKASGNRALIERALPHFLSRDASTFWLSGQWMTETTGGSDVGNTETIARQDADGQWRLHGRKWFSSAVVGEAALALARPEGAGTGTAALALVLCRDDGRRTAQAGTRHRPAEGQARHTGTAHRGNPSAGPARVAAGRARPTACARWRRCSTSPAPGMPSARSPAWRARSAWRAITPRGGRRLAVH